MKSYNYMEAVTADVLNYIKENEINVKEEDRDELAERLQDELWANDSVTGNGSGSYTFSTWQAEENICHNLDLLAEACNEFGDTGNVLEKGAEACDVTIRCYLLPRAIWAALEELEEAYPLTHPGSGTETAGGLRPCRGTFNNSKK